ncbi:conserved hypothetical protein [Estrella lausannensis]|uniref:Integrase catalytic domain-containing protein n=2 Tax=Estrella lausannensis TaxID=483423 RepID=A0A0H5DPN2_9BACT|nr:conserved hypothetical protein [Estrella lausannensis]
MQNDTIESFNDKVRDEFLNQHLFLNLKEARHLAKEWSFDYNRKRSHSTLKVLSLEEFKKALEKNSSKIWLA